MSTWGDPSTWGSLDTWTAPGEEPPPPPPPPAEPVYDPLSLVGVDNSFHTASDIPVSKITFIEGDVVRTGLQGVQGRVGKRGVKGPVGPAGVQGPIGIMDSWEGVVPASIFAITEVVVNNQAYLDYTQEIDGLGALVGRTNTFALKGGDTYIIDINVTIYANDPLISLFKGNGTLVQEVRVPGGYNMAKIHAIEDISVDTTYYMIAFAGGYVGIDSSHVSIVKVGAGPTGAVGASPVGPTGAQGSAGPAGPQGPPAPARTTYQSYYS